MAVNPSPFGPKPQFLLASGAPAAGYKLFFYVAGSVGTKQNTYTDSTGGSANTNPIILNSLGEPTNEVWWTAGQSYKVVYAPSADTDPPTSPIWTIDNLRGINDTTTTIDEWVAGATPTYVSATQFTLVGDQTTDYAVGRRLKFTVTAGTVYGTITASAYTTLTTVTVVLDSGALDSGLSAVSLGLLRSNNSSVPGVVLASGAWTFQYPATFSNGGDPAGKYGSIQNLTFSCSVGAGALTIALKDRNGIDPSAASPCSIPFRNVTPGTGNFSIINVTAANSLVISAGSTLGTTASTPFRFWITGHNDGGTFRLGVINCLSGLSIYPLRDDVLVSSTAEGGAGAADSAQVIYTGTAVASKAMRVLGYLEFSAGLATAGTYSSAPTKIQLYGPGISLPGQLIQTQRADVTGGSQTITLIPYDNTTPQNTEGAQVASVAITPTSTANLVEIHASASGSRSTIAGAVIGALFQDATADALTARQGAIGDSAASWDLEIYHRMLAGTVLATTFKSRYGPSAAGTMYFNRDAAGADVFNGKSNTFIEAKEIMA